MMKICHPHFLRDPPSPRSCMTSSIQRIRPKSYHGQKVSQDFFLHSFVVISLFFSFLICLLCYLLDGTSFEVKDPKRLELEILPKYFRHARFQSFVRQLNFYSFKKISKERNSWVYSHEFFQRGNHNNNKRLSIIYHKNHMGQIIVSSFSSLPLPSLISSRISHRTSHRSTGFTRTFTSENQYEFQQFAFIRYFQIQPQSLHTRRRNQSLLLVVFSYPSTQTCTFPTCLPLIFLVQPPRDDL